MPYLVSDAVPKNNQTPTSYVLSINGAAPIETPATVNSDGTVQLKYDISGLPVGNYTVTVGAKNSAGVSANASPFAFTISASAPLTPTGLKISQS
jgi:predicted phage tail protein